uniref:Uncharacterized protein n=1 Tax=Sphaerodactylus townsendi TaxID=933632 RepID=A0ACB8G1A8_9SAUR
MAEAHLPSHLSEEAAWPLAVTCSEHRALRRCQPEAEQHARSPGSGAAAAGAQLLLYHFPSKQAAWPLVATCLSILLREDPSRRLSSLLELQEAAQQWLEFSHHCTASLSKQAAWSPAGVFSEQGASLSEQAWCVSLQEERGLFGALPEYGEKMFVDTNNHSWYLLVLVNSPELFQNTKAH